MTTETIPGTVIACALALALAAAPAAAFQAGELSAADKKALKQLWAPSLSKIKGPFGANTCVCTCAVSCANADAAGCRGPCRNYRPAANTNTCATACAASTQAVGEAAEVIRRGAADVVVAGGTEAGICEIGMGGFSTIHALTATHTRLRIASTA